MYDIMIIGGGAAGCAAARELSRYKADICVVEKEEAFAMAAMGIIPLIDMSRAWNTWKSKKGQCEQLKGKIPTHKDVKELIKKYYKKGRVV